MRWGSASYYVTRRAVSITHAPLHELFMSYARSHWYPASELLIVLIVATSFSAPADMFNASWMLWLIALALLYVPFLYNPNALRLSTLCSDIRLLREWLSTGGVGGDPRTTWHAWWEEGTPQPSAHGSAPLFGQLVMFTVYAYLSFGVLIYSNAVVLGGGVRDATQATSLWQLSLGFACVLPAMVLAAFDANVTGTALRQLRLPLMLLLLLFAVGWFVGVTQFFTLVSREIVLSAKWAGAFAGTYYAVPTLLMHTIALNFGLAACGAALTIAQVHVPPARALLRWLHRTRDYLLLAAMLVPVGLVSLLPCVHYLQSRIVFQSSGFFFSDTPRGRRWCAASFTVFLLLVCCWIAYATFWFLGYVPAPPTGWLFEC